MFYYVLLSPQKPIKYIALVQASIIQLIPLVLTERMKYCEGICEE